MQTINYNSFVILAFVLVGGVAYLLFRDGAQRRDWVILGSLLAVVLVIWLLVHPSATAGNGESLSAEIGHGQPVLLEFQSPY